MGSRQRYVATQRIAAEDASFDADFVEQRADESDIGRDCVVAVG
jgi:hypothetical protein